MNDPDVVGTASHASTAFNLTSLQVRGLLALAFSLASMLLAFLGLLELDVPITRFVRSLNDYQADHLHNPWLARLSDLGDRLGKGETLIAVSLALLVVGYGFKLPVWKNAGWQTLWSHALAGLGNNVLKHLIGRARPKFMHAGNTEFSPLSGSGWDSFPSGHSTASFAVAIVLAVRFPRIRWIILLLAMAVAASRVVRGSHFLTDVVGGAVLGMLVGMVAAHPWKEWRSSLESALFMTMPVLVALFTITWTIGHQASDLWMAPILVNGGMVLALAALFSHVLLVVQPAIIPGWLTRPVVQGFMGVGLGCFSGSVWVAVTVLLACLAYWIRPQPKPETTGSSTFAKWLKEGAIVLGLLVGLYAMAELRGALPML